MDEQDSLSEAFNKGVSVTPPSDENQFTGPAPSTTPSPSPISPMLPPLPPAATSVPPTSAAEPSHEAQVNEDENPRKRKEPEPELEPEPEPERSKPETSNENQFTATPSSDENRVYSEIEMDEQDSLSAAFNKGVSVTAPSVENEFIGSVPSTTSPSPISPMPPPLQPAATFVPPTSAAEPSQEAQVNVDENLMNWMETTTENATPIFTITGMELEHYNAARDGTINVFEGRGSEQIQSILTPIENTILHIHFKNYTHSVSDTFVEQVLAMCPALLLKTNVKDETILHIAARYGHHEIVRKLLDHAKALPRDISGVGVEKRLIRALTDKKDTALHEAARYNHTEVVKVLIDEEPDHSYFGKNDGGETPLYIAVERKYWSVVDTLLGNTTLPQYNGPNGRTALHAATIFGDNEKVAQLLARNLSATKAADENGWVPLHLAALVGNPNVVEELVGRDRSTAYMRDKKLRTALHLAALGGYVSAMKMILKSCPDCSELVDEKGCNALHYIAMDKGICLRANDFQETDILENTPLMRNLCNEKDDVGNTPLHYIAQLAPKWETHYDHVLLEPQFLGQVDMMACNKYGQNPLDVAAADTTQDSAIEMMGNKILQKLQDTGATLGARVLDKRLREKKQEKRHDPAVDEEEKENETNGEEDLSVIATSVYVVAILIATVTFAAGFMLPGGLNQEKGSPTLKYNAAFIAFVITDSLSLVLSTSAVLLPFYSTITLWGRPGKKKSLHFGTLAYSAMLTIVAMGFMIIAFGTGIYAVLGVSRGFGIVTLLIVLSFFFVIIRMVRVDRGTMEVGDDQHGRYHRYYKLQRARDIQLSYIP